VKTGLTANMAVSATASIPVAFMAVLLLSLAPVRSPADRLPAGKCKPVTRPAGLEDLRRFAHIAEAPGC